MSELTTNMLGSNKRTRGRITLVFDDGYEHILSRVVPELQRRHLVGVFAIPTAPSSLEASEGQSIAPATSWQGIEASGHELAAHSVNHVDLTTLTAAELHDQLLQPQRQLKATTLVYPGGAHSPAVVKAAATMYRAARTVEPGFATIPPGDPWRLPSYNFTRRNFTVRRANLLAAWAWFTNRWLIETYHLVDDAEAEKVHAVPFTAFCKHLDFIARLPIQVCTIRDVTEIK